MSQQGDTDAVVLAVPPAPPAPGVLHAPGCGLRDASLAALLQEYPPGTQFHAVLLRCNALTAQCLPSLQPFLHPSLVTLELSGNPFGVEGLKLVAERLAGYLGGLQRLDLRGTDLDVRATPYLARVLQASPQLTYLSLSENPLGQGIRTICKQLVSDCPNLKQLRLSRMHLGSSDLLAVAHYVRSATALQSLDLAGNAAVGAETAGAGLFDALREAPALQDLNVSYTSVTSSALRCLADGLRGHGTLRVLTIGGNALWDLPEGAGTTCALLGGLPQLTQLDVGTSRIRAEGLAPLLDALRLLPQLKSLNLASNRVCKAKDSEVGPGLLPDCLVQFLQQSQTLTALNLTATRLSGQAVHQLAEALGPCPLVDLNLSKLYIGPEGVPPIAKFLAGSSTLETLNLSDWKLKQHGLSQLARDGLAANRSLWRLYLGNNYLRSVKPLLDVLKNTTKLRVLDLSQNEVLTGHAQGAEWAGQLLPCVEALDLSENPASLEDLLCLKTAQDLHSERRLSLHYLHPVDDETVPVVVKTEAQRWLFRRDAFFGFGLLAGRRGDGQVVDFRSVSLAGPGRCRLVGTWLAANNQYAELLDLANTRLNAERLPVLLPQLLRLTCLTRLYLEENPLGVAGTAALREAVPQWPALAVLRFNFCARVPTVDNLLVCGGRLAVAAFAALAPELLDLQHLEVVRGIVAAASSAVSSSGSEAYVADSLLLASASTAASDFWAESALAGGSLNSNGLSIVSSAASSAAATWTLPQLTVRLVRSDATRLGRGAYGQVYRGTDMTKGTAVAVKVIDVGGAAATSVARVEEEVRLLARLSHKNIVKYFGCSLQDGAVNIVMEFVPRALQEVITELHQEASMTEAVIQHYSRQILEGLEYLHECSVVHRDVKPGNVLVDTFGVCKVADFGSSKELSDLTLSRSSSGPIGTPLYMAPEVMNGAPTLFSADVWSFGCTVYEMFLGLKPWHHLMRGDASLAAPQLMFRIVYSPATPLLPGDPIPPEARDFLALCFARAAEQRPSCAQLLQEPWLASDPGADSSALWP